MHTVKILVRSYNLIESLGPLACAIVPVLNINETITFSLNKITILYFYLNVKHKYYEWLGVSVFQFTHFY
jgi:hypothetical protein